MGRQCLLTIIFYLLSLCLRICYLQKCNFQILLSEIVTIKSLETSHV